MEFVFRSALNLAQLLCMSLSLSGQSWKELAAVDYCLVSDDLVEHA